MTTAIATYYLDKQCGSSRPFCPRCINTFAITTCGPTKCQIEPPAVVCLVPQVPPYLAANCGDYPDCGRTMPGAWYVVVTWPDIDGGGPFTAGSLTLIGETQVQDADGVEPSICGTAGCGFSIAFSSDAYPRHSANPTKNYTLCMWFESNGAHGSIKWDSGAGPKAHIFTMSGGTDWTTTGPAGTCTDYTRVVTVPMTSGIDPGAIGSLGITITMYPFDPL